MGSTFLRIGIFIFDEKFAPNIQETVNISKTQEGTTGYLKKIPTRKNQGGSGSTFSQKISPELWRENAEIFTGMGQIYIWKKTNFCFAQILNKKIRWMEFF